LSPSTDLLLSINNEKLGRKGLSADEPHHFWWGFSFERVYDAGASGSDPKEWDRALRRENAVSNVTYSPRVGKAWLLFDKYQNL
jgi:hypothetical protein